MSKLDYIIVRMRSWVHNYGHTLTQTFREDIDCLLQLAELAVDPRQTSTKRSFRKAVCHVDGPTIFGERIDLAGTQCLIEEIDEEREEYLVRMPQGVDDSVFYRRAWFPKDSLSNICIEWNTESTPPKLNPNPLRWL